jgi:poly(A) polymerase
LLFARVNLAEAGDKLDIEKDEILRGVDDASQRSLNGERPVPYAARMATLA